MASKDAQKTDCQKKGHDWGDWSPETISTHKYGVIWARRTRLCMRIGCGEVQIENYPK
jgi:hypothetical protein